jgi:glycosyltransferase involved in cell wall biosynthesis
MVRSSSLCDPGVTDPHEVPIVMQDAETRISCLPTTATKNSASRRRIVGEKLRTLGRSLAEFLPQNNAIPRLKYLVDFSRYKRKHRIAPIDGFSLVLTTRNRREFLACAVAAVVANTQEPFEIIIMDNASDDGSEELCHYLEAANPGVVRHVRLQRNIGTNAYALGFLQAQYKFLVDMDDDILALSKGWDRAVIDAFGAFPRLGFLAMNVVQDEYTNGAKKGCTEYADVSQSHTTLQLGPTGGWFSATTREIYNEVGGFVFRPYKPFPPEDGKYIQKLKRHGYFAGILKNKYVYHASGPYWNLAYGYQAIWDEKYRRDHKDHLPLIRNVRLRDVPSVEYAERMVIKSEQSLAFSA